MIVPVNGVAQICDFCWPIACLLSKCMLRGQMANALPLYKNLQKLQLFKCRNLKKTKKRQSRLPAIRRTGLSVGRS